MNDFKNAKKEYDNIEIPNELNEVVQNAIEKSRKSKLEKELIVNKQWNTFCKWGMGIAAAFVATMIIGVNTSETFAKEIQQIPVIGTIAKVFTIRYYEKEEGDKKIKVEVPQVQIGENDKNQFTVDINAEIEEKCDLYLKEANERADEYKKAFLETGGTEEEWKEHDIQIKVDYDIKSQTDDYLSFVVNGTENWTSAYAVSMYYNLDLKTNKYLNLQDVLGSDYINIANESIKSQIKTRQEQDSNVSFFTPDEGGFETISKDTKFYMNEKGNPVIVFDKYEVAPGYMGSVEFEIQRQ